jgi:hypothetical protein
MKKVFIAIGVTFVLNSHASQKDQCLTGNYLTCHKLLSEYGSSSNKNGAVELFNNVCGSSKFKLDCRILTVLNENAVKKTLDIANAKSVSFVISKKSYSKIYQVTPLQQAEF